jgi:hypothetical protein
MEIVDIFEIVKDNLYVVKWDTNHTDELIYLFGGKDQKTEEEIIGVWRDVEILRFFFNKYKHDLQSGFYGKIKTIEAIRRTTKEANELEKILLEYSNNEAGKKLDDLFKPLDNSPVLFEYQETKAYGSENKSWLRLYAIRITSNKYVITGGAIKLTENMNTRPHLKAELIKLELTQKYLVLEKILKK